MSLLLRNRRVRFATWMALGVAAALGSQAGCFPEYKFDDKEPGDAGGGASNPTGGGNNPTGGGGGGSSENCTNGVDDDADGLMDCADPKCTDFACVPEVPAGWAGYFALYDGAPAGDPGCPQQFPSTTTPAFQGNDGLMVPDAACSCTCTPPAWTGCAPLDSVQITTGDAPCGQNTYCSGPLAVPAGWTGSCHGPNHYLGGQLTCGPNTNATCSDATGDPCNVSVRATAVAATGGSCTANPVVIDKPDLLWDRFGRACGDAPTTGLGCNVGQTCLPRLKEPYESGVCVSKEGDNACPPGAFTEKHVFYSDVEDTRSCTDNCSCGAASGGTCPTTISIYSDTTQNTCVSLVTSFPAGTCKDVNGNPTLAARAATTPGAPTGGSCPASGGTPTGTVTPINPTTFCCIP